MPRYKRLPLVDQLKIRAPYGKPLTKKQRDFLRLVGHGFSNREIGEQLHLSQFTIKSRLQDLGNQTGIGDRTALAVWAFAQQIRDAMFVAENLPELRDKLYQTFEEWLSIDIYKRVTELPTGLQT